ncbi:MAG: hypothetical protein AAFY50_08055 [Cyanobacteria bacterium J06648_1]
MIRKISTNIFDWYVSGFSKTDKKFYKSPRFWRVVLTLVVVNNFVSYISTAFSNTSDIPSISKQKSSNIGASSKLCINNFNDQFSPLAYATLNKNAYRMEIIFSSDAYFTPEEFSLITEKMTDAIFSTCSSTFIESVSVEHYAYKYPMIINR